MTNEIIEIARQAGIIFGYPAYHDRIEIFAKLVAAKERERCMQLFLDPENQPTQFGTATQEYREQEIKDEREACAKVCDAHTVEDVLVGVGIAKSCAEVIRARGTTTSRGEA